MHVGVVPTMPERVPFLENTVRSVFPQLDILFVYLNNFNSVPEFFRNYSQKKLIPFIGEDRGAAGRFFMCDTLGDNDYFHMFDDDLIYPGGYVKYKTEKIEQYHRKAVITLHGKILRQPITTYFGDMIHFNCRENVENDVEVHVGGTGVMSFHSSTLKLKMEDFKEKNYDATEISIICQRRGIPIICAAHKEDYLIYQEDVPPEITIWYQTKRHPLPLVAMAKSIEWKLTGIINE